MDATCQNFVVKDKSGHYAIFERCLNGWGAFESAATSAGAHWFKDLLSLWRPSGHCSGETGLRLAIRNGYLNFYRLGQSVARVDCVSGVLRADVHHKYILREPQPGMSKSPYLRLTSKGVSFGNTIVAPYEGISTLLQWISVAGGEKYAGVEKSIVDELVSTNDHVVDLEMALPAWTLPKVAVRMDLVAIESGKVVFWEVKTVNDSRIRCNADFEEDNFPHVVKQLSNYRVFLEQPSHVEQVETAYRNTAKRLVDLRELANKIGPALKLGDSIVAASQARRLDVARLANLVVVDLKATPKGPAWTSWKSKHEVKLKGKIPMLVLESPARLELADAK